MERELREFSICGRCQVSFPLSNQFGTADNLRFFITCRKPDTVEHIVNRKTGLSIRNPAGKGRDPMWSRDRLNVSYQIVNYQE